MGLVYFVIDWLCFESSKKQVFHIITPRHVTLRLVKSHHAPYLTSEHITSRHVTSRHLNSPQITSHMLRDITQIATLTVKLLHKRKCLLIA